MIEEVTDVEARSESESDESLLLGPTFRLQTGQTLRFLVNHGSIHLQ